MTKDTINPLRTIISDSGGVIVSRGEWKADDIGLGPNVDVSIGLPEGVSTKNVASYWKTLREMAKISFFKFGSHTIKDFVSDETDEVFCNYISEQIAFSSWIIKIQISLMLKKYSTPL